MNFQLLADAERSQRAGGFPNGPLYGMEPIAAIGKVGHSKIFAGWDQIFHADWDQAA